MNTAPIVDRNRLPLWAICGPSSFRNAKANPKTSNESVQINVFDCPAHSSLPGCACLAFEPNGYRW
jgi:hypothetical protein